MRSQQLLETLAKHVRREILMSTSRAGSGHPTSSLSATERMVGILFGGVFHYDVHHPDHPNNDRLFFLRGTPLFCFTPCGPRRVS